MAERTGKTTQIIPSEQPAAPAAPAAQGGSGKIQVPGLEQFQLPAGTEAPSTESGRLLASQSTQQIGGKSKSSRRSSLRILEPEVVGSYRVLRRLGIGGMGLVYEALDESLNRKVALKLLRADAANEAQVDRFMMEAKAAAAINHPNIIQVYSVGKHEGCPYFAMELVEGRDLESILSDPKHPLTIAEALAVVTSCVRALVVAQEHGIVHRDIKPANIMVNHQGLVKVMDFGIAKASKLSTSLTAEGAILGTPDYISPEQATGETNIDSRADMYSLGCVFYRCLSGRKPFSAETPMEVICCHLLHQPEPLRNLNGTVPYALNAIVERMMAKDPSHRYQFQQELLTALEGFCTQADEFEMPANELQVDLAWHGQDPATRPPRRLQLIRKPAKKTGNTQVLRGFLMNLPGVQGNRSQRSNRSMTAAELASRLDKGFDRPRRGLPYLLAFCVGLALFLTVTYLGWKGTSSDPRPARRGSFLYQPGQFGFLPPGWRLDSALRQGVAMELVAGREIPEGLYELRFQGPAGRVVTTTVSWSPGGIAPLPSPTLFEGPKMLPKSAEPRPGSAAETVQAPVQGRMRYVSAWTAHSTDGWSGGTVGDWQGRSGVLVALPGSGSPPFLSYSSAQEPSVATGGTPASPPLLLNPQTRIVVEVWVEGSTQLKLQLFSRALGQVAAATRGVEAGGWRRLAFRSDEFRNLKDQQAIGPGTTVDSLGLFVGQEPGGQADRPRALALGRLEFGVPADPAGTAPEPGGAGP